MKPPKKPDPAARVDVAIERMADLFLTAFVDNHPLTQRLRQAGLDVPDIVRTGVKDQLKREKPFWDKTARRLKRLV